MGTRIRKLGRRERGSSLVELAMVAPLLVMMLVATADIGSAITTYITLNNAAREGARLAGRGNVFGVEQVLQVVAEQSNNVDIVSKGAVVMTTLESVGGLDGSCCTRSYSVQTLCGSAASHFSQADLEGLWESLTPSLGGDPDAHYMRKEELVVIEVFYGYESITSFLHMTIPMYAYCVMPVSAPS